ncbi:Toll/interleukin-1 receptor (TIR) domain [Trinorchestia longiramus]|nr:Toll/interleukin-1 receptor (TIR) domain [Trinorchestia longiramus]
MAEADETDHQFVVAYSGGNSDTSIRVLGPVTHSNFSSALDSHKILLSTDGFHRDWRGLAEFARLDVPSIAAVSRISFTSHCLHLWCQAGGTLHQLYKALVAMDRHDVIHDTKHLIEKDIERIQREGYPALLPTLHQQDSIHSYVDENILTVHDQQSIEKGGGLTHYDALVLHADEDLLFLQTLLNKLEGEYGLKLCVKDRDLIGGLQFESSSVVRLITERCSRVIVLFSKSFLASPQNKYFLHFAHALSIDQRRRIVIPCLLEPCDRPAVINFCHSLDYFRAKGYWDYWKKLRDSIVHTPPRSVTAPPATITELPSCSTLPELPSPTLLLPSLPPSAAAAAAEGAKGEATARLSETEPSNYGEYLRTDSEKFAAPEEHHKNACRLRSPGFFKWRKRDKKIVLKKEDQLGSKGDASKTDSNISADFGCAEASNNHNLIRDRSDMTSFSTTTDVSFLSVHSVNAESSGDRVPPSVNRSSAIEEPSPENDFNAMNTNYSSVSLSVNGSHAAPSQYTSSSLQRLLPDVEPQGNGVVTEEIRSKSSVENTKSTGNPVSKFLRKAKKRVKVSS